MVIIDSQQHFADNKKFTLSILQTQQKLTSLKVEEKHSPWAKKSAERQLWLPDFQFGADLQSEQICTTIVNT